MSYEEIISGLHALEAKDFDCYDSGMDGPQRLDQLMDALIELPSPERAIPELFALMERLPDSDLGAPGPLVHTLERMDYEDGLVASIRCRPTDLAIWMVNRILNTALPPERRKFYLGLLASVATHSNANESARYEARHFIEFQSARM